MDSATLIFAATLLLAVAMIAIASLRGWQGWLQLKVRELDLHRPEIEGGVSSGMARIEIADLKERIRKLEAIAAGVDL
jgi:ABC-type proline/glycine betaine transport system permease subunit